MILNNYYKAEQLSNAKFSYYNPSLTGESDLLETLLINTKGLRSVIITIWYLLNGGELDLEIKILVKQTSHTFYNLVFLISGCVLFGAIINFTGVLIQRMEVCNE